jgi:MoaA/NifB/PqqE/SkfB family radical SAM enzyme
MIVEWEVTLKCNYKCGYCTNLDTSLRPALEDNDIREFIKSLGEKYPGVEIFVFGGEPFVHPKIGYIIKCFNEFNVPFVVQTNFSKHSIKVMKTISDPFKINISIHPSEIALDEIPKLFNYKPNINMIDVMYTGKEAVKYYFAVKNAIKHANTFLTPVTDFGDGVSNTSLAEYLELKKSSIYSKIIRFEEVEKFGRPRSEIWLDPTFTTKGKPCLYKDTYHLYSPNLDLYNCCYRIKTEGICPKDKCFLM